MTIAELQARLEELHEESQSILAAADADKRDQLLPEEQEQLDSLLAEIDSRSSDLARMQAVEKNAQLLSESAGRHATPEQPRSQSDDDEFDDEPAPRPKMSGKQQQRREPNIVVREDRSRWGWRTFGEFSQAVKMASINGGTADSRLTARMAPTTYGTEGVGADGGFAVPPDFRNEIMSKVMGEDQLISRTDQTVSGSNSVTLPVDTTTPWQTSGGILAYWDGEAQQLTQSKPALEQVQVKLNKLTALVPVSDELLEDVPALDSFLRRKAPEKMNFKINDAIINGTGVGQPLGLLNSGCKITVADQNGAYIEPLDIWNMWTRLYAPYQSNAVWLVNQDVLPELYNMRSVVQNVAGTENVGGNSVFIAQGSLANSPYSMLLNRPIIPVQSCKSLNTPGDIILTDLSQYMTVTKGGGIRADTSIHLFFDYSITAFRFIFRVGGRPMWDGAISPANGSNTLSSVIVLDTRT